MREQVEVGLTEPLEGKVDLGIQPVCSELRSPPGSLVQVFTTFAVELTGRRSSGQSPGHRC